MARFIGLECQGIWKEGGENWSLVGGVVRKPSTLLFSLLYFFFTPFKEVKKWTKEVKGVKEVKNEVKEVVEIQNSKPKDSLYRVPTSDNR